MTKVKQLFTIALALTVFGAGVATFYPVTAAQAAEGDVAEVGGTSYQVFDEAIANWTEGTTLKLLKDIPDHATVSLKENVTRTLDLNGHMLDGNTKDDNPMPGAVIELTGGKLTITDTSAAKNGSITGGGGDFGGGIIVSGEATQLDFVAGSIKANYAKSSGAGMYVKQGAIVNIKGGTVEKNQSDGRGGGVSVWKATLNLESGSITENTAENGGAGVYTLGDNSESSVFNMTGGTIKDNRGGNGGFGGGVKVGGNAQFVMKGGTVENNSTHYGGGGVSIDYNATATFGGSAKVSGNSNSKDNKKDNIYLSDGGNVVIENSFTGELGFNCTKFKTFADGYTGSVEKITADDAEIKIVAEGSALAFRSARPVMIKITKAPKDQYEVGEDFDWTGTEISVIYKDGTEDVKEDFEKEELKDLDGSVLSATITYRENGYTLTTRVEFTVTGVVQGGSGASQGTPKSLSPFGFIAVVLLSGAFVIALIVVGHITDSFKSKKKSERD